MAAPNLWFRPNEYGGMRNGSNTLVQFRAGKCRVEGTRVTPENTKGMFQIVQDQEDLKHLQWKNRSTGRVEDDFFIFSDVDLKRMPQAHGRVFLLRWRDRSNKLFFWMQEPNADKDDELYERLVQALNGPVAMDDSSTEDHSAAVAAPAATPATYDVAEGEQRTPAQITTEQLQSIFQSMVPQMTAADTPSVADLLSPEVVLPILQDPEIEQSLQSLVQHLPDGDSSPEAIAELLRSSQFRQQVDSLSVALQSGEAGELLRRFGIDSESNENGMTALLQGLLRYHAEARNKGPSEDQTMDES